MDARLRELQRVAALKYWREADAQIVVDAWKHSGESVGRFAQRWELTSRRVDRWARRLGGVTAPEPKATEIVLRPVTIVEAKPAGELPEAIPGAEASVWIAEVVRGRWAVNVPCGFEARELSRLLHVIDGVAT